MKSQKQKILEYIKKHGSISSWEAYSKLGITQLGARLHDLKKENYKFETEWVRGKKRNGKKTGYKKYKLYEVSES